jgi:hypothetical protein
MNEPKFPISDSDMLELLKKYPFLKMRNFWKQEPDDTYKTDEENIEHNKYKIWDGTGWEDLWKNRYLPRLFKEYDSWDDETKKQFFITDTKEKYGELRIYTSFSSDKNLESIAEWLSGFTCQHCGAEPRTEDGKRVIWTTGGWITHLCRNCAIDHLLYENDNLSSVEVEKQLNEMKTVQEKPFGFIRFSKDKDTKTVFKETSDNWLEVDHIEELDSEEFKKQFIADLKGE